MDSFKFQEEEGFFTSSKIIIISFLLLLVFFFVYLYFANMYLIKSGQHLSKDKGKKSKKGKEIWSYGD